MSTIGKFFVVLNLVLAGLFVGSAAALIGEADSFRQQYEAEQTAKNDLQASMDEEVGRLQSLNNQAQSEVARLQGDNSTLNAEKTALTESLETERQQNGDLRESLQTIEGKLGDLEGTNRDQANQLDNLRRQYDTVRQERDDALDAREQALATANAAEDSANMANGRASDLELELARALDRAEQSEAQLGTVVALYDVDLASISAQPQMEGSVLSVDYVDGNAYVVINLGRKDGVQRGYSYDVYNGATYKGRIQVQTVNDSKSAATVSLAGSAQIAAGDRIVTRL
jgi:predicted RNase H-like nuclease (RuvC/YqgF family)